MFEIRNNLNNGLESGTLCEGYATIRKKWLKKVNILVMECCYRSNHIDENGVTLKGCR